MDPDLDTGEALSSPLNETEALMEADEELEEEDNDACTDTLLGEVTEEQEDDQSRTKSVDSIGGASGGGGSIDETSKLLNNLREESPQPRSNDGPGRKSRAGSSNSISGEPKSPREPFSYAYHFKKKYTFRSDSVYSDVTPMSSATTTTAVSPKTAEPPRDKSGSLSSLKGSTSKWVSLKKKLGKLNSQSSGKNKQSSSSTSSSQQEGDDEPSALQQQAAAVAAAAAAAQGETSSRTGKPIKSLQERRSLLQRAKTLSILPVNSAPKTREAPKKVVQPPELFNVGGEMNLIPLEMLIDINDIKE